MSRLFGTDGIRGVANVDLKPTLAYALGRAVAHRLAGPGGSIVVGQDTRRSGDMFVSAIVAGATSLGVDAHVVGTVPTPALAFIAGEGPFAAGIMVSASHNPAADNGLKVLDAFGLKLDDGVEDELEALIWRTEELPGVANDGLGRMVDAAGRLDDYLDHRRGLAESIDASGLHLVLDAANGSGSVVGPEILQATGARLDVIHAEPDGININVRCGATAPASLAEAVVAAGADAGFALDGDADRLIAVDASGLVVDGDQVLGILALDRLSRDALPGGGLVVSVLSNGGLQAVVEEAGGQVVRTPVGDKYILEGMQVSGAVLGGEKSGHVILLEHTTSGDGIVTALEVLRVMVGRGRPLAELAATIPLLPQQQRAVKARHKDQWEGDRVLQRAIADASRRLGDSGRVLVRPSGTEPALRVMVEGEDEALVTELADTLAALVGERLD
ncbi:MAG: phosphoglucosamine mutase [Chloroflexota bacterium]